MRVRLVPVFCFFSALSGSYALCSACYFFVRKKTYFLQDLIYLHPKTESVNVDEAHQCPVYLSCWALCKKHFAILQKAKLYVVFLHPENKSVKSGAHVIILCRELFFLEFYQVDQKFKRFLIPQIIFLADEDGEKSCNTAD